MMHESIKNTIVFTIGLLIITLLVEYYRKGSIQIDNPQAFLISIVVLGVLGGAVYNYTYGNRK